MHCQYIDCVFQDSWHSREAITTLIRGNLFKTDIVLQQRFSPPLKQKTLESCQISEFIYWMFFMFWYLHLENNRKKSLDERHLEFFLFIFWRFRYLPCQKHICYIAWLWKKCSWMRSLSRARRFFHSCPRASCTFGIRITVVTFATFVLFHPHWPGQWGWNRSQVARWPGGQVVVLKALND